MTKRSRQYIPTLFDRIAYPILAGALTGFVFYAAGSSLIISGAAITFAVMSKILDAIAMWGQKADAYKSERRIHAYYGIQKIMQLESFIQTRKVPLIVPELNALKSILNLCAECSHTDEMASKFDNFVSTVQEYKNKLNQYMLITTNTNEVPVLLSEMIIGLESIMSYLMQCAPESK